MASNLSIQTFQQNLRERDFRLAVMAGYFEGVTGELKFGYKETASTLTDIWLGPVSGYVFPVDAGQAIEAVSDNAADVFDLTMRGVDAVTGADTVETITLNGLTPVSFPGAWKAVNIAYNNNGTPFTGTVTLRGTGTPNSNVFAVVPPADQQSTQLPAMIPEGKIGFVVDISVSINKTGGASAASSVFRYQQRKPGKVWRTALRYGAQTNASSAILFPTPLPLPVPPGTQIRITADPSTTLDISAEYALILVDTELLTPEALTAIIES